MKRTLIITLTGAVGAAFACETTDGSVLPMGAAAGP